MEQNRTKIKSNPIERLVFNKRTIGVRLVSNKIEHLFCYFELIEQTKSNQTDAILFGRYLLTTETSKAR